MNRRELITFLGGTAAASTCPFAVRAQAPDRVRRIGVLSGLAEEDPESQLRAGTLERALRDLGWIKGRNLQIEYRSAGDGALLRKYSGEMVQLAPELIVANSTPVTAALQERTSSIPILFVQVTDPVGQGFAKSLAQPGGNITGITNFEFSIGSKWLEALKEAAPHVTRVAVVYNADTAPFANLFIGPIVDIAPRFAIVPSLAAARDPAELERAIVAFARDPNGGLVVLPDVSAVNHRNEIIALAQRYRLPAIYPYRLFATSGGLMSYGSDVGDVYRNIARYADRVLRGAKPADIPVQAPTRFELVINLKSAKTIQLDVAQRLLALADEIIE